MQDSENNESPAVPNPNQAAPAAPTAIPPMTPAAPSVMPQPPTAIPPMTPPAAPTNPQSNSSANTNDSLGVISILSSLIPPAGLILGILSVVKGSKSKNKKLTLFGGVAILLSVIIGLLYVFVLAPRIPALAGSKYSKTKNITINKGSLNLTIPIPEAFNEDNSFNDTAKDSFLETEQKTYSIYADPAKKQDILAILSVVTVDLSGVKKLSNYTESEITVEAVINELVNESNEDTKKSFEGGPIFKNLSNLTIVNKEKSGSNGATFTFTAEGKSKNGKKVELLGKTSIYINSDFYEVGDLLIVEKNVYNKNKKAFDNIDESIKTQIK